jgi:PIN domain nuclease of toxin-antitoxin system
MKVLLDTSVFLWMISKPERLSKKARAIIRLLISQSQLENLPLLTKDKLIKKYSIKTIW